MMELLSFHLIPGIVLGSIYALGAIGITLTFSILRFANFAHGEMMTLGAYFTFSIITITGMHPIAAMPFAMILTAIVTLGVDRVFYKPLRSSPVVIVVIASFGMMLMIRSVIQFFWGVQLQTLMPGIQYPMVFFETLRISPKHIVIVGCAFALMFLIHLLLTKTKTGKAMRAMSDSPELARLTGINTESVIRATWIVGAFTAVAAGVFLAYDTHIDTMMGFGMLLPVFASALLGGIGKPYGAMAGGLIIGIVEEMSSYAWIGDTPLLSPGYKAGVSFAIMVAILIWRPSGLFRGRVF